MTEQIRIPMLELSDALVTDLHRDNPWWTGQPTRVLPPHRRHFIHSIHRRLEQRLAAIIVVRGPRQVGKTTAQLQVIQDLLSRGVPARNILRVQFDEIPALAKLPEPILRITDWFEKRVLGESLNSAAHAGRPTYLFFDEVQNLSDWATQLKHLVDSSTTQVVVTGSSALRIEQGRDSLAGRINTLEVGTLTLREISEIRFGERLEPALADNGLEPLTRKDFWVELRASGLRQRAGRDRAFRVFSERGGYPIVHERAEVPWPAIADQLNETVIKRVITHDLRVGDRGRKRDPSLLEELFRLACRYAGQAPAVELFVREAQRNLNANVGTQRVRQYLGFLDATLLLRLVQPLEVKLKRARGHKKICLADHGLRASWLQELVPLSPEELDLRPDIADLAGRIAESIAGAYFLGTGGLDVAYVPERKGEPEVDFVLTVGSFRIPVEVKYRRRIDPVGDTEGLRTFIERAHHRAPFGLLVTLNDEIPELDPRIVALPLSSLLTMR